MFVETLTKIMLPARTFSLDIEADFFILVIPVANMNAHLLLSDSAQNNLSLVFLEHLPKLVDLLRLLLSTLVFGFFFQVVNEIEQGQVDFLTLLAVPLVHLWTRMRMHNLVTPPNVLFITECALSWRVVAGEGLVCNQFVFGHHSERILTILLLTLVLWLITSFDVRANLIVNDLRIAEAANHNDRGKLGLLLSGCSAGSQSLGLTVLVRTFVLLQLVVFITFCAHKHVATETPKRVARYVRTDRANQ